MSEKRCSVVINDVLDQLKEENRRLSSDLSFERKLNAVLDNIRNYSQIIINDCKCKQNQIDFKRYNDFNKIYIQLKASKCLPFEGICHYSKYNI